MSDTARGDVNVQLGARAQSILQTLSGKGRDTSETAVPETVPASTDDRPAQKTTRAMRAEREASKQLEASTAVEVAAPNTTVVSLPQRSVPKRRPPADPAEGTVLRPARRNVKRKSLNVVKISALLGIALPTALATVYFLFIAAPQYVAEARFTVRGPSEAQAASSMLGALTGMGGIVGTGSDSFIVAQYIESAALVASIDKTLNLRSIYTTNKADFVAKYTPYDNDDTIEHLTRYWSTVSWVYFEPVTSIITFTVRAFTPEDALNIARETIRESEKLVNKLSERASEDLLMQSKQEQSRAELRLKFARKAIQDYRDRRGAPDAQSQVEAQFKIVAEIEGRLAKAETDLEASGAFLSKDAPTIRFMKTNVDALRSRVEAERAKIGSLKPQQNGVMSASMAEYETLATEREFAEKAYQQATTAVEGARIAAERQSRYLSTFVEPHLPQDSLYPARLQMIFLVLVCSALAWGIGVLVFYGIRDHAA